MSQKQQANKTVFITDNMKIIIAYN